METAREDRKFRQQLAALQRQEAQQSKRLQAEREREEQAKKKVQQIVGFHGNGGEWVYRVPDAPVFHPTEEEFKDPMRYIQSIQSEASRWGICKIVPPVTPATPAAMVINPPGGKRFSFTTRHQSVKQHTWDNFDSARFFQSERKYTLAEFEKLADDFQRQRFGIGGSLPAKMVEAEYWRQMQSGDPAVVEYGNDVEGTGFAEPDTEDPLAKTDWNLRVLPTVQNSTLRLLGSDIPGVTSPMLYVGMLFATFAWHVEDQYLYSINYQHLGAAKTWYGVPAAGADGFERVVEQQVYRKAMSSALKEGQSLEEARASAHTALLGKTTMFSPKLLMDAGVPVCRAVQNPGEYIVTFPRAYHGGFSNGFNVGEAVNFAIADWFRFGADSCLRYSRLKRPPMMPQEQLLCIEAEILEKRRNSGCEASSVTGSAVQREFAALITKQAQAIQKLEQGGATIKVAGHVSGAGIPCDVCGHVCYLAHALRNLSRDLCCLRCAQAAPQRQSGDTFVLCHRKLADYRQLAASFELELASGSIPESTLRMEGLTESQHWSPDPQGFASDSDHSRDGSDTSMVDPEGRSLRQADAGTSSGKRKQAPEGSDQQAKRARIGGEAASEGSSLQPADLRDAAAAFLRALDRKSEASRQPASSDTDAVVAPTVPPAALQEPEMVDAAASAPAALQEPHMVDAAASVPAAVQEAEMVDAAASAPAAEASSLNAADAWVEASPAAEVLSSLAASREGGSTALEASPAAVSMAVDAAVSMAVDAAVSMAVDAQPLVEGDNFKPQQSDEPVEGSPEAGVPAEDAQASLPAQTAQRPAEPPPAEPAAASASQPATASLQLGAGAANSAATSHDAAVPAAAGGSTANAAAQDLLGAPPSSISGAAASSQPTASTSQPHGIQADQPRAKPESSQSGAELTQLLKAEGSVAEPASSQNQAAADVPVAQENTCILPEATHRSRLRHVTLASEQGPVSAGSQPAIHSRTVQASGGAGASTRAKAWAAKSTRVRGKAVTKQKRAASQAVTKQKRAASQRSAPEPKSSCAGKSSGSTTSKSAVSRKSTLAGSKTLATLKTAAGPETVQPASEECSGYHSASDLGADVPVQPCKPDLEWVQGLDLASSEFARAGSTRNSNWAAVLQRHQASWEKQQLGSDGGKAKLNKKQGSGI